MDSFIIIWRYKIKSEKKFEFENLYGQQGDWVKLFKNSADYLKTELFKENESDNIFITIDYWKSKEAYYNFKEELKIEFLNLDKKGEELTEEEKYIGNYFLNSVFD